MAVGWTQATSSSLWRRGPSWRWSAPPRVETRHPIWHGGWRCLRPLWTVPSNRRTIWPCCPRHPVDAAGHTSRFSGVTITRPSPASLATLPSPYPWTRASCWTCNVSYVSLYYTFLITSRRGSKFFLTFRLTIIEIYRHGSIEEKRNRIFVSGSVSVSDVSDIEWSGSMYGFTVFVIRRIACYGLFLFRT